MKLRRRPSGPQAFLFALLLLAGCSDDASEEGAQDRVVIGLVGKSQGNAVFQAAYLGAQAAAVELGAERGLDIVIDWQTPPDEDAAAQAAAIEQLARSGAAGIAVSCSHAETLTPAINRAVDLGTEVVCFDSDAPKSQRFAFFGTDDNSCGAQVMDELAKAMGEKGSIAILAGNQAAPNLQARVAGVKAQLLKYPEMNLVEDGVFYHEEVPEVAAEVVARGQSTHPEIDGWAFVGGWPLFTAGALRWDPGSVKVVSVDALQPQLRYLESGHVEVLLAQDCFAWGYRSVELLLDLIVDGQKPEDVRVVDALKPVRMADVDAVNAQWKSWLSEG
ncbi:MAG: substrate-binding domain-containing protein [Planctomycetota bacterium]|jgi:ribose transport system substrate-binding protein|nr:substrate-binding domain-containing protein [Planctomycetota bacterium]